ncbi:hypothetical protein ODI_R1914 [Orrella dioscoreae]|uniref:Uncharacterized protein n=1 Tax=Orrella dioscoreae TaxID=1851544 RepID=A0A1C3K8Q8_9BURK|nr:hypothetical protein ODI_02164 [Orrella dioscoreae]SOE49205.1 hypothetical protein ODI_R1914 [Orrella dioscoreae]
MTQGAWGGAAVHAPCRAGAKSRGHGKSGKRGKAQDSAAWEQEKIVQTSIFYYVISFHCC